MKEHCVLVRELPGENMCLADVGDSAVLSDGDTVSSAGHRT